MDHVRDLLPRVLRRRGMLQHAEAALVILHAQRWIDTHLPAVAKDLRARSFREGVLTVETHSSIASQECALAAQELLEGLRGCPVESLPKHVRVVRAVRDSR